MNERHVLSTSATNAGGGWTLGRDLVPAISATSISTDKSRRSVEKIYRMLRTEH